MQSKVLIFFHSATGNTGWISKKLADAFKEHGIEVDTFNIAQRPADIDFSGYDLIGFGCPIMGFRPSFAMASFINSLPMQKNVPAFIFITYTGILANGSWVLASRLQHKGFVVVADKKFFCEESWPILRTVGIISNRGKPNEQTLPEVNQYARQLFSVIQEFKSDKNLQPSQIPFSRLNPFYYLGLKVTPKNLRGMMGKKTVDEQKCTQCGYCSTLCAVEAIRLNPYPTFDEKCTGCWGCFNICPEGAIRTVVGSKGRYRAKVSSLSPFTSAKEMKG
jgi:flavodoxin/NAD-dependent dihydropyrimidine dehydrogenase PreA subunit